MRRNYSSLSVAAIVLLAVLAIPGELSAPTATAQEQTEVDVTTPDVVEPVTDSPSAAEYFQLSYPLSTKAVYWNPANVIYSSHVDHTPSFYNRPGADGRLQVYTGEEVSAYYLQCGYTRNREYCYTRNREYCYGGHSGLDIAVGTGVPIYAAHAGTVEAVGDSGDGYGIKVVLRDVENPQFLTLYGHLDSAGVTRESLVARGQLIGYMGNTGNSSGPHLHFGLYYNVTVEAPPYVLDPYGWFSQKPNPIGAAYTDYKWAKGPTANSFTNEPIDWNEGTVTGNEYIRKNRSRNGAFQIGAPGVDHIERWWANNLGSAGAPRGSRYWDYSAGGYCQSFEGGTYCPRDYYRFFTDVPITHWAHRYIGWAAREGIISGYADRTFRPSAFVIRRQFAKMVVRGFDFPINTSGGPHFCDVPRYNLDGTLNEFYDYIETLYNLGIMTGKLGCTCSGGCFRESLPVERGEVTKVMVASAQRKGWLPYSNTGNTRGGPDYIDVPVGSTFYTFTQTLYNKGAVQYRREQDGPGNGGHYFVGWQATRAQIAMFLHELVYATVTDAYQAPPSGGGGGSTGGGGGPPSTGDPTPTDQ